MTPKLRLRAAMVLCSVLLAMTAMLASSAAETSAAAQQPAEPVFSIVPGVSEQDAGFAIEGIRLAQDFFVNRLDADIFMPLRVNVLATEDAEAPTRIAVATEDEITVYTGSRGWLQTSPAERFAVIVHEYTHFYQYLLLQERNFDSPAWFDEGVAEFLSALAMSEWGVIERADFEAYWATFLLLAPVTESLDELESWPVFQASEGAVYPYAYFAVSALFPETDDLAPIRTIYTLIGAGQSFDAAFTLAFGFAPSDHYARLSQDLGAPFATSEIPDDILVYRPIERVTTYTPSNTPRTVSIDQQVLIRGRAMPASVCNV
ncbi:MAG: hypothetical protein AB7V46_16730, partial [Thermomicrobiales bacterium]